MTLNYKKICLWAMVISYPFVLVLACCMFSFMFLASYTYGPAWDDPIGEVEFYDLMPSGIVNGHDYVDLGLSVKWATCNVGAIGPKDFGDVYVWGGQEPLERGSKYEDGRSAGEKSPGDISGTSRDVARVKWGSRWRMPTKAECEELLENCNFTRVACNGIYGYQATSQKNGKSIFFPDDDSHTNVYGEWDAATFWTATPGDSGGGVAYHVSVDHYEPTCLIDEYFHSGRSVRPVSEK